MSLWFVAGLEDDMQLEYDHTPTSGVTSLMHIGADDDGPDTSASVQKAAYWGLGVGLVTAVALPKRSPFWAGMAAFGLSLMLSADKG